VEVSVIPHEVEQRKVEEADDTEWDFLEEEKAEGGSAMAPVSAFEDELQLFWEDDWTNVTECALAWWQSNKLHFPCVTTPARILLIVTVTSTASE